MSTPLSRRFLPLAALLLTGWAFLPLLSPDSAGTGVRAQDNVTFTFVGEDDFIFCQADSAQTITITPDPARTLVELRLIWIVGTTQPIVITDPTQLTHSFIYPVEDLPGCSFDPACDGLQCFDTRVLALYDDSPNFENITRTISFRKPPELSISGGGTYCTGQTATLRGTLCPTGDPTEEDVIWTLPDGSRVLNQPSIDFDPPGPGTYTFRLSNTNECGTGGTATTVRVIDPPDAVAVADSNVIDNGPAMYRLCFEAGTRDTIRINSDQSTSLTDRRWRSNSGNARILGTTDTVSLVEIRAAGTYTFTLTGRNTNCNLTDEDQFVVEVIETAVLRLTDQPDVCISLDYTPTPFNNDATYTVDGMVVPNADFPLSLGVGRHTVLATLPDNGICPTVPLTDTFDIAAEATALIATPADTLCDTAPTLTYSASPAGGTWRINGQPFNGSLNPGTLPGGSYVITYGNEPCLVEDQTTLLILSTAVTVPTTTPLCVDQAAVDFSGQVTPAGGTFSGTGVTADGRFDPTAAGVGTYDLTYSFANALDSSCGGSGTFRVVVSELDAAFQTGDCDGTEVCFTLPAGAVFDRTTWDFGGLGTSNLREPCFDFPGDGNYTVTLTTERGPCTATASQSIVIAPAPAPNFSLTADPDGCSDLLVTINNQSSGGGSGLQYNWTLNGTTFSTAPNPGPLTLGSVINDSLWTIGLTLGNACQENAAPPRTVTTRPRPAARFDSPFDDYCSGDTIVLSNNSFGRADTYRWTLDGTVIGTDSLPPFLSLRTDTVRTIELCLQTTSICGDSLLCRTKRIVPTNVEALFSVRSRTICAGDSLRIGNLATNGVPVRYDLGDGRFTTDPNPVFTYATPGTYRITQTAFGCGSAVFFLEVTVTASPVADFAAAAGCPGLPVTFTNNSDPGLRSEWDFGDGSATSADFEPEHVFAAPGDYEVCLTVADIDPAACSRTRCRTVTISTPPTAGFTAIDSTCAGEELALTSTATGDGLTCRYDLGNGNFADACDARPVFPDAGNFAVTQVVTDARGCTDTALLPVFVRPLPEPAFAATVMDACHPDSVRFTNATPVADGFRWDFGDGNSSTLTNPVHAYANPGTYVVRLTATTGGLCPVTTERSVTINEMPTAAIRPSVTALCFGETLDFDDVSSGTISNRRWDFGDGTVSFEANPRDHRYPAPGTYQVTLSVFNNDLCADSTTLPITVHDPVLARTQVQREVDCQGDASGLLDIEITSGSSPFNYVWSNGGNTDVIADLTAGIYQVTITDANGCTTVHTDTITEPERIESAATVTTVTCFGGSDGTIELAATGGTPPYRIDWPGGSGNGRIENLAAGDYPITITDGNGCVAERTINVPENPPITVVDTLQDISCFGEDDGVYTLQNLTGGVGPYRVRLDGPNDYSVSGTTVNRFDGLEPGFYTFSVSDDLDCGFDREFEVREPDEVVLEILQDTIRTSLGVAVPLAIEFNAIDSVWRWEPSADLTCGDCATPVVRAEQTGWTTYVGLLTDGAGCRATDTVTVFVSADRDVYIPNTFTPNGDGRNDLFRVRSEFERGIDTIESFIVYDRWGGTVFEQREIPPNDPAYGWDGRKNGVPVQPGVYVYQVIVRYVDRERIIRSGSVELIR